jgi:hypothetical protein
VQFVKGFLGLSVSDSWEAFIMIVDTANIQSWRELIEECISVGSPSQVGFDIPS